MIEEEESLYRKNFFMEMKNSLIHYNSQIISLMNDNKNIYDYFEPNHLGEGQVEHLKQRAQQRKELIQWPFGNTEIISNASLNFELDIIKKHK